MVKVIKTLMTLREVSQSDLAKETGVSMTAISRYLTGVSEIRSEAMIKILQFLGADVDKLVKNEISKALGNQMDLTISEDIGTLLTAMEPIERRTLLDGLISKTRKNLTPEAKSALFRIKKYRSSISTVRRI